MEKEAQYHVNPLDKGKQIAIEYHWTLFIDGTSCLDAEWQTESPPELQCAPGTVTTTRIGSELNPWDTLALHMMLPPGFRLPHMPFGYPDELKEKIRRNFEQGKSSPS